MRSSDLQTEAETRPAESAVQLGDLRVAIVHYWLLNRRGGERVIDTLLDIFPQADLFTLVLDQRSLPSGYSSHRVNASWLQHLPGILRHYQKFVFLAPHALEQFDLSAYDLVISSEAGPAKGVLTRSDACHICYCHSPMRYIWDLYQDYLREAPFGFVGRAFYSGVAHYLRQWDYATAARVDYFVANSRAVATRIRKAYRRAAKVIHPPVDIAAFPFANGPGEFYLVVSALSPYKRVDLAVSACTRLNRKLVVIGDGKEFKALRRLAGSSITFLGHQPDAVVRDHYRRCRALLFPGEEDFGITVVEAQACGRPVIAYGRGGALDAIVGLSPGDPWRPGITGMFFPRQKANDLIDALLEFEQLEPKFDALWIRRHSEHFDTRHFKERFAAFVASRLAEFQAQLQLRPRPASGIIGAGARVPTMDRSFDLLPTAEDGVG
jgi:glycosyltransferase involved in cell wall biosynthesis